MQMCLYLETLVCTAVMLTGAQQALGGVVEFESFPVWQSAVGDYQTIYFTDYPKFTFITDQYSDLGVSFLDGDDNIQVSNNAFPPDLFGLDGNSSITMDFTSPQNWIGVTYPGTMIIWLYSGDDLIYTSGIFDDAGTPGAFAGLVSEQSFDRAFLFDIGPDVNIGDLYFGALIPSPGPIALIALPALLPCRSRRA